MIPRELGISIKDGTNVDADLRVGVVERMETTRVGVDTNYSSSALKVASCS